MHPIVVCRLLHSGLFHRVRDRPELLAKVCLVQGDLSDLKKYRDVLPLLTPTRRTSQASGSTAPTSPVSDSANGSPASNRDVELGVLHPAAKHDAASVGCWDVQGLRTRAMTVAGLVEAQHALCAPLVVIHCAARYVLVARVCFRSRALCVLLWLLRRPCSRQQAVRVQVVRVRV